MTRTVPGASAATRAACSRLRGPSAPSSSPARIAAANASGRSTVTSQKNAVSSTVSVPCVTTTASSCAAAARRATSSIVAGVTFQPLTRSTSSTTGSNSARPGTPAISSSAPTAGRTAPVSGSASEAMVPPVAMTLSDCRLVPPPEVELLASISPRSSRTGRAGRRACGRSASPGRRRWRSRSPPRPGSRPPRRRP